MTITCRLLAMAAFSIAASLSAHAETPADKPAATATPIPTLHCDFKTVSACSPDGTCKAGKDLADSADQLIVHGIDGAFGWQLVIHNESQAASISFGTADAAIMGFGTCTNK
jgi:hypothetical protein